MKKLLNILFFIPLIFFSQGKLIEKKLDNIDESFQKKFKIEKDIFDNILIIKDKKTSGQNIRIKPYLVIKNDLIFFRVSLMYQGFDWLEYDNFKFLINDNVYELPIGKTRKEINSNFNAVEYTDIELSDSEIEIFNKIAFAKTPIKYRISGVKKIDLKLYENDYIKNIVELYYLLTNKE